MRRGPRTLVAILATLLLLLASVSLAAAQTNTTEVVKPNDVSSGPWYFSSSANGNFDFMYGPATPPLGIGSVELTTASGTEGILLYTETFDGTALSDIQDITYSTYRSSFATDSSNTPYIEFNVTDGTNSATFIFDPVLSYGSAAPQADTWQSWDAMADSQTTNDGGWWSPDSIGSYTANTYVSWSELVNDIPGGTISSFLGFGAGDTGVNGAWDGAFTGNVDALMVTMTSGDSTTYNFDPYVNPPTTYAQCYFNGWQTFDNPAFSSRQQCADYVAAQQLRNYYCSRFPNLSICQDGVVPTVR